MLIRGAQRELGRKREGKRYAAGCSSHHLKAQSGRAEVRHGVAGRRE